MDFISPDAEQILCGSTPELTRYHGKPNLRTVYGVCVHTTGSGVTAVAKRQKRSPWDVAVDIYLKSQLGLLHKYKWGGPTYLIDTDGSIGQFAPENFRTEHCGGTHRLKYLSGSWIRECSPKTVKDDIKTSSNKQAYA